MVLRDAWRSWVALGGALVGLAALAPLARGQDAFEDVRKSCLTDYRAKCTGNDPPYDIMVACLNQYFLNLSPGCQEVLRNAPRSSVGVGYAGGLSTSTPGATGGGLPGAMQNPVQNPVQNPMQNPSPGVMPPEEKVRR